MRLGYGNKKMVFNMISWDASINNGLVFHGDIDRGRLQGVFLAD